MILESASIVISGLFVLWALAVCVRIWWILASGEVQEYRRMYRETMLRKWLDE
jgi:hypothetical protein